MADPKFGKNANVKIGTTVVELMGTWSMTASRDIATASAFNTDYSYKAPGAVNWAGSFNGLYDYTDAGQVLAVAALSAGTLLTTLRLYEDGTYYWTPDTSTFSGAGVYVSNLEVGFEDASFGTISFSFEAHGPMKRTS